MRDLINAFNERSKYYISFYFLALAADLLVLGVDGWTSLIPFKIVPLIAMIVCGNFHYHKKNGSSKNTSFRSMINTMGIVVSILTSSLLLAVLFWCEARIDIAPILFY